MAVARLTLQMTGGGPWGFRLYGGDDDPLIVAKLRKRSKAHDSGLEEGDVLLGINSYSCRGISHGTAMALVDAAQKIDMEILRGSSDHNAVNAAFQALGSKLRPVPQSALPQGATQSTGSQFMPPAAQAHQTESTPKPQDQLQTQHQIVNGYTAPSAPSKFSREQKTFKQGDTTTHVTTETSEENRGGTTITKVKRETVSHSFGQAPSRPMFPVARVSGKPAESNKPGVWAPSGGVRPARPSGVTVNAPSGVHVQHNPDQSITMTIGLDDTKENVAPFQNQPSAKPAPPLFKVAKFGTDANPEQNSTQGTGIWTPGNPAPKPIPAAYAEKQMNQIPLLPDEEAAYMSTIESLKKPFPVHLQRILVEGSDLDSGPESPSYLSRSKMDSFDQDSDDDPNKMNIFINKKMFSDSAFYDDPEHKYPTIGEQVKMARKVAMSLLAPANKKARGHRMFIRRMVKSQKWTADQDQAEKDFDLGQGDEEEKYYHPNPWEAKTNTWEPAAPVAPVVPLMTPTAPPIPVNLFQPTLPTGPRKEEKAKALSAEEFERMRLFESKSDHTQVSPQMCFSLAEDLRNMKGKGGKLFAKRVARSEKWGHDENPGEGAAKPNQALINKIAMQAAAAGMPLMPMPGMAPMPGMTPVQVAPKTKSNDPPTNRLKDMIDPPKPKMTPWDAAAEYDGNIDEAFDHLRGYKPYGRSQQGEIADNLDSAIQKQSGPPFSTSSSGPKPVKHLPTSGQPAKLPEFTRKIKPWSSGGSDSGSSASGAPFSSPASQAAAAEVGGFRSVSFKAPGSIGSANQHATSPAPSGGSYGGAASFGAEEVGFCDL